MALTLFAHDFVTDVLCRGPQFILAVRTLSVEGFNDNGRCIREWLLAVFALYFQIAVLRVNPQFLPATGTTDIMTFWRCGGNHGKLRQGYEHGNLDTVFREFRI